MHPMTLINHMIYLTEMYLRIIAESRRSTVKVISRSLVDMDNRAYTHPEINLKQRFHIIHLANNPCFSRKLGAKLYN